MPWRKWLMLSGECLRCSKQQPVNHSNHQIKGSIIFIYFPLFLSLYAWVTLLCVFSALNMFFLIDCVIFILVKMTIIPAVSWRIIQHDQHIVIIPLIRLNYHNLFINDIKAQSELQRPPLVASFLFERRTHHNRWPRMIFVSPLFYFLQRSSKLPLKEWQQEREQVTVWRWSLWFRPWRSRLWHRGETSCDVKLTSSPERVSSPPCCQNGGDWEPLLALFGKKICLLWWAGHSTALLEWRGQLKAHHQAHDPQSQPGNVCDSLSFPVLVTHILNPCIHLLLRHRPLMLNQLHHCCRALFIHLFRAMFIYCLPIRGLHVSLHARQ